MKSLTLIKATTAATLLLTTSFAWAATKYELTITNGSQMPISPAAIYVKNGGESASSIGKNPSVGFIQLCQTGTPTARLSELRSDSTVSFVFQAAGPILPGETRVVEVEVAQPQQQSIHFETMYGKTKDVCGVGTVNSHSLVALKQHVADEIVAKDNAVQTGAFTDPTLPPGMTYLDPSVCPNAMNAVSCLRELSSQNTGKAQIRFFSGYFPSLVSALESKYGSADVQTLLLPVSGAIQFKLKLKH